MSNRRIQIMDSRLRGNDALDGSPVKSNWLALLSAMILTPFLLTACLPKKSDVKAEPLPKMEQKLSFQTTWKAHGGSGPGKLMFNLAPAYTYIDGQPHVVTADHVGRVFAINAETGKQRWKTKTKLPLTSAVGTAGDKIVVGSQKADVVALDKSTGTVAWKTKVSTEVLSGPMGSTSGIAVLAIDSRLQGLNPETGREAWLFDASAPSLKLRGGATPLVVDDKALVGFANGQTGLFELSNGRPLWMDQVAQPHGRSEVERMIDINGRMAIVGDTAYVVTFQGKVAAIDIKTSEIKWTRDASSFVGLTVSGRAVIVTDSNSKLFAFNRFNGDTLWTQDQVMYRYVTAPVVYDDTVIVADADGYISAFSLNTGEMLAYDRLTRASIFVPPLVDKDGVIVQTHGGQLIKFTVSPRST